ncbi:unnamed protein product [Peronospora belbahrii]|uniref:DRBM domain-containing protein n=1 Tax=Peronospora belbahrii TaxID=622444 RepID=A0AAU9L0A0_9STRA|nr:unnamed protein product [Peronospora belbahrii]
MAHKEKHGCRLQCLSARKFTPISANNMSKRQLWLRSQTSIEREEEEGEEEEVESQELESNNECRNLFCRQILANRFARYCEDKPICQRYRALKLQCLANVQAKEDEEDSRPLSLIIKRRKRKEKASGEMDEKEEINEKEEMKEAEEKMKKKKVKRDETFTLYKRKKSNDANSSAVRKKRLNLNLTVSVANEEKNSNSSSLEQTKKVLGRDKKREVATKLYELEPKEEKQRKKRAKKAQAAAAESKRKESPVSIDSSNAQARCLSLTNECGFPMGKHKMSTLPLERQSTETGSDAETGKETNSIQVKRRRLDRRMSVDKVLARSSLSSPTNVATATSGADLNYKNHVANPDKRRTSAQVIRRNMNVDLVPLGVARHTSFAGGGGRYVQNGNRFAAQSLRPSDPRPRPPSMTKFRAPLVSAPLSASLLNTSSRPAQRTQLVAAAPPLMTQRPSPPLPSQVSLAIPPVLSSTAETVMIIAPPDRTLTTRFLPDPLSTSGVPEITRISTTDYLKSKKRDCGRQKPEEINRRVSRSSSLERSGSFSDDRAFRFLPVATISTDLPGYNPSDSAPLLSYTEARSALDSRRPCPKGDGRHQRLFRGNEGSGMKYRERAEVCSELERFASQREYRNLPPPRDPYPFRPQDSSSLAGINNSGNGYAVDRHFSSALSPADHIYRRSISHEEPLSAQHRRSEHDTNVELKKSDCGNLEEDAPTFSHNEAFLPRLLSVFVGKLPHALEAVLNVTKKPRKMNWYINYIERIERLCKAFDLHVKFDGLKSVVTVQGREWLTLQGTSTVALHLEVIKSLRAEAVTWLRLNEEMKTALAYCKANKSHSFVRAWNDLKHTGNYISLPRETKYFCGARLHHWTFVVGKVEIGSGSHQDKREAFRLATISALNFLLSIGRGERRPTVKCERVLEEVSTSATGHHRPSRCESLIHNNTHASPTAEAEKEFSSDRSSRGPSSSVQLLPPAAQPSSVVPIKQHQVTRNLADTPSAEVPLTSELHSYAERSGSPATRKCIEKATVASTPVLISNDSHKLAEAAKQCDLLEEKIIHDDINMSALTSARSPRQSITVPPEPPCCVETIATFAAASVISTSLNTEKSTLPGVSSRARATTMATSGISVSAKDTLAAQTSAVIPPRRCMMCEMIRMRKPDGERCLRCKQNDAPVNKSAPYLAWALI